MHLFHLFANKIVINIFFFIFIINLLFLFKSNATLIQSRCKKKSCLTKYRHWKYIYIYYLKPKINWLLQYFNNNLHMKLKFIEYVYRIYEYTSKLFFFNSFTIHFLCFYVCISKVKNRYSIFYYFFFVQNLKNKK